MDAFTVGAYSLVETSAGWEIFEHGATWGVAFDNLYEAESTLRLITTEENKQ